MSRTERKTAVARSVRKPAQNREITHGQLFLIATVFLVMGLLLGWFGHAVVSGSRTTTPAGSAPAARQQQTAAEHERIAQIETYIQNAEEQLATSPDNATLRIELGNLYFDLGTIHESIGHADPARTAYVQSIAYYEAGVSGGRVSADILTDLGTMYYRARQPHRAVESYERALQINGDHLNALLNTGVVKSAALRDTAGAVEALQRYVQINPSGPDADRVRTMIRHLNTSQNIH